jgi:type IV secretion system protein TrbL
MKRSQTVNRGVTAADHAIRSGDRPSGGSQVDLSEGE